MSEKKEAPARFRHLKPHEAKLLYEIWQVEYLEHKQATRELLATRLQIQNGTVSTRIARLRDISKVHYVLSRKDNNNTHYILAQEKCVTYVETARILMEILDYPQHLRNQNRIPYDNLVARIETMLSIPTDDIIEVLQKAEKTQYLEVLSLRGKWVVPKDRVIYEKTYITLLASHFVGT